MANVEVYKKTVISQGQTLNHMIVVKRLDKNHIAKWLSYNVFDETNPIKLPINSVFTGYKKMNKIFKNNNRKYIENKYYGNKTNIKEIYLNISKNNKSYYIYNISFNKLRVVVSSDMIFIYKLPNRSYINEYQNIKNKDLFYHDLILKLKYEKIFIGEINQDNHTIMKKHIIT